MYLATRSGQFSVSLDEGRVFGPPSAILVSRQAVTNVQALGVLAGGKVVLVYAEGDRLRGADGYSPVAVNHVLEAKI